MKRCFDPSEPELMDRPQPVTRELQIDLDNLRKLNRNFGSYRLIKKFLSRWFQTGRSYRILDFATGSGDIPRMMILWARKNQIELKIDAVDFNPSTLEIAKELSAGYPEISFIQSNALTYHSEQTYDLVHCSLALHHFSEDDAIMLLCKCRELSHHYVLVADLERNFSAWLGVYLVTAILYREPMTKFDGRLSVKRSFSFAEVNQLARKAGWNDFGHCRFLFARQALWIENQDLSNGH